jgi:predicted RNase H-like nuclease
VAALRFLGLDLGWTSGATGVAAVAEDGRLVDSGRVQTDDEIAGWVERCPSLDVVAVDAPLVVPNELGMREPERLMASTFGRFGASAHVSNRTRFGGEPRAMRLARRFGWGFDPAVDTPPLCVEVYPHPALVGLFQLPYRLDYKKGPTERRLPGFRTFLRLLESVPELRAAESRRWAGLRQVVADPRPGDLNRVEDEIDAILCAYLAWMWRHRREMLTVYGSVDAGYIVAPPPPAHTAVVPMQPLAVLRREERVVLGRPAGDGGDQRETEWKKAVRDTFGTP